MQKCNFYVGQQWVTVMATQQDSDACLYIPVNQKTGNAFKKLNM
jgi:hypothetical protein